MKFGYARVSKNEQSLDVQIQKLTAAGCDEIFQEKISGAKDDRPQLKALMGKLRKGDILCVVRLDRLGRRMMKLVELINDFKDYGGEAIEVISADMQSDDITALTEISIDFNMFATSGSDFHGDNFSVVGIGKQKLIPQQCTPIWQKWLNDG